MTFFGRSVYIFRTYALALLPLSHGAPELSFEKIQVAECRSGKIRAGGAALRCVAPYFDHWSLAERVLSVTEIWPVLTAMNITLWRVFVIPAPSTGVVTNLLIYLQRRRLITDSWQQRWHDARAHHAASTAYDTTLSTSSAQRTYVLFCFTCSRQHVL